MTTAAPTPQTQPSEVGEREVKRTERGWLPIGDTRILRFVRNTLLESGEVKIVVLTRGENLEMLLPGLPLDFERFYLTEVHPRQNFHMSADWMQISQREIQFYGPCSVDYYYTTSCCVASELHESIVDEITQRMLAGEFDKVAG